MSEESHSLDEWIMENEMEDLVEEIECHVTDYLTDDDSISDLTRHIMISIRQHMKMKGFDDEE